MNRTVLSFFAGIGMLGVWATACSGAAKHSSDSGFGGSGGKASTTTGSAQGGSTGNSMSTSGDISVGVGGNGSGGGSGGGQCAGNSTKAMEIPLDMFIMLDQSGSMSDDAGGGQSKWQRVTGAIQQFVQQPSAAGIGVGIQYFGLPAGGMQQCTNIVCQTDADCGPVACGPCQGFCVGALMMGGGDSCNASDYATADVAIAPLPGNANAIIASMGKHMPSTSTPTSAALQGSIDYAKKWAMMNPSHVVVNIFATDGDPTECDTNLSNIDAIAAAGVNGMPKILTYVIGVGPSLQALDGIAAAGGTMTAFHVDQNPNANKQLLDALNMIRGTALACAYQIPPAMNGNQPDYTKINVIYKPGNGGMEVTLDHVDSAAQCQPGKDEWYYDDPKNPKQILLCPDTCANLSKDTKGEIDIAVGCKTKIPT